MPTCLDRPCETVDLLPSIFRDTIRPFIVEFPDVDDLNRVKAPLSIPAQLNAGLVHEKCNETFSSLGSTVNTLGKIPEAHKLS
jgi:hypothetical protein